ncbi:MAG: Asp-tRNA(Asn)/Glu-tRNA(Gln) amidotransferase subunit GatA [Bdellovibrionaceae bacterium]|nr:Asp-tRNA(Asn)/Glu-tRNA(Gln) amidotransferase subunit GatA [Pseudobdellovibrionaceae bacterium]
MDLLKASFKDIAGAVQGKKVSAREVTKFFFDRAEKLDPKLNSYIQLNDKALDEASSLDARIVKGENVGPLAGVPFGIKDMFCTKGLKTTAGSKILANFVPPYDSTVVERLKKSGVTIIGKLNQDEFAMGSSNETSAFGAVKNPWNTDCVPGGSSGGSAAAQASRLCAGTVGTDTGGSIRQPASFCGIVGVKPTYGRISRYGIVAYASSLDQAGPMVSTVEDAALSLEVMCGHDERDATTSQRQVPRFSQNLKEDLKGLKIGLMKEYMTGSGLHADVQKTVQAAIDTVKARGAEIVEVSVPLTEYAVPMYYLIAASECSSNLARYDGVKYGHRAQFESLGGVDLEDFYKKTRGEGFGKEVKRRIMLGTYCLSSGYYDAYYNKACQVRRLMRNQYDDAFKKCDIILSPVTTSPAFRLGDRISDPLAMYLNDIFTVSTNLAGLPGMSVPFGMSADGLPIGVQLTAHHFEEQKMLNAGFALEQSSSVKAKVPHVY